MTKDLFSEKPTPAIWKDTAPGGAWCCLCGAFIAFISRPDDSDLTEETRLQLPKGFLLSKGPSGDEYVQRKKVRAWMSARDTKEHEKYLRNPESADAQTAHAKILANRVRAEGPQDDFPPLLARLIPEESRAGFAERYKSGVAPGKHVRVNSTVRAKSLPIMVRCGKCEKLCIIKSERGLK